MELIGDKIYLLPLEEEDLHQRVIWLNDPETQKYLSYDTPVSYSKTKMWFSKVINDPSRREFSIYEKDTDRKIGFCGLIHIENKFKKAELHIVIGVREKHNKGIGTDVIKILTMYGLKELGLHRIYSYALTENIASHNAFLKAGWKEEGILREDAFSHGAFKDRYIMGILKNDIGEHK